MAIATVSERSEEVKRQWLGTGTVRNVESITATRYHGPMIRSFGCKETEKVFERQHSKKLVSVHRVALRKLLTLDAAEDLNDLRIPPSNHLEKLSGKREGQYSIRVNDQWRVCFRWEDGNAYDVEIVDYH